MAKVSKYYTSYDGVHYYIEEQNEAIEINREDVIKELDAIPREKINEMIAEIEATKCDMAIYEYAGAYTDGKLAAHSYDLQIIKKYCGEGNTNEN